MLLNQQLLNRTPPPLVALGGAKRPSGEFIGQYERNWISCERRAEVDIEMGHGQRWTRRTCSWNRRQFAQLLKLWKQCEKPWCGLVVARFRRGGRCGGFNHNRDAGCCRENNYNGSPGSDDGNWSWRGSGSGGSGGSSGGFNHCGGAGGHRGSNDNGAPGSGNGVSWSWRDSGRSCSGGFNHDGGAEGDRWSNRR